MDGLRLALIVAGIALVAAVYFWSARRRRLEREAGDFDRFDAWTDDRLDPLADAPTQRTPGEVVDEPVDERAAAAGDEVGEEAMAGADLGGGKVGDVVPATSDPVVPTVARAVRGVDDPDVLQGLEAIAESLDARVEPAIGEVELIGAEPASVEGEVADDTPRDATPQVAARGTQRRNGAADWQAREHPSPSPTAGGARRTGPGRLAERGQSPPRAPPVQRSPPKAPMEPELVVVLNVMAPIGQTFDGPPLRDALEHAGLRAGDLQLYHYLAEGQPPAAQPIFSALNMIKPGTLAPEAFEGMRTPGVALVLRLPGPERPREAFELMHGTAMGIAEELGGRLCDETRSTLTAQALNHLRERIAELARRQRLGG